MMMIIIIMLTIMATINLLFLNWIFETDHPKFSDFPFIVSLSAEKNTKNVMEWQWW